MSKWDKLINRILTLDKNLRFDELKKVLESYGYQLTQPSKGSSHMVFRKKGSSPISIPCHEPIKVTYVEMVRTVIEEESENEGL